MISDKNIEGGLNKFSQRNEIMKTTRSVCIMNTVCNKGDKVLKGMVPPPPPPSPHANEEPGNEMFNQLSPHYLYSIWRALVVLVLVTFLLKNDIRSLQQMTAL